MLSARDLKPVPPEYDNPWTAMISIYQLLTYKTDFNKNLYSDRGGGEGEGAWIAIGWAILLVCRIRPIILLQMYNKFKHTL